MGSLVIAEVAQDERLHVRVVFLAIFIFTVREKQCLRSRAVVLGNIEGCSHTPRRRRRQDFFLVRFRGFSGGVGGGLLLFRRRVY